MEDYISDYFTQLSEGLNRLDTKAIQVVTEILDKARKEGRLVFICGNGGSAATASHFANDLNKLASPDGQKGFKALALTDNVPLITAWGNDSDYEDIFSSQIKNFIGKGDVIIGISGSGNSKNVIRALEFGKQEGATTIGFLGFDGGEVKNIVDYCICFEEDHYGRIEDAHLILEHLITNYLRDQS